jgi:hypothetical protein
MILNDFKREVKFLHEKYPEPNPVVISANQLRWALEMYQVNVRLNAEAAGNITSEPKKRRWWQRKNKADADIHQESEVI